MPNFHHSGAISLSKNYEKVSFSLVIRRAQHASQSSRPRRARAGLRSYETRNTRCLRIRKSPQEVTKAFETAHSFLCSAIELASKAGNDSLGITDMAMSMISNVQAAKLPGSKQMARELAFEFLMNAKDLLGVCSTDHEKDLRAGNVIRAYALAMENPQQADKFWHNVRCAFSSFMPHFGKYEL